MNKVSIFFLDWDRSHHIEGLFRYGSVVELKGILGQNNVLNPKVVNKPIFLDDEIKRRQLRAYLVNTIHDEQQYEVHVDDSEELVSIADPCMTRVSNFFEMTLPLNADAKIGKTWQETH